MMDSVFLNHYREVRRELAALEEQLERMGITGRPAGAGSFHYDGMPHGTNHATAAAIQHQEGLEEMAQELRAQLDSMEARYSAIARRARNVRERLILRGYYHDRQTDASIAEALDLSPRHVNRLRKAFLAHVDNTSEMSGDVVAGQWAM